MEYLQLQQEIESLTITNDEELENANELAKKVNKAIKEVKASHKDEIAKYHALHKEAKSKEKEELKPLEKGKEVIKKAIGDYMKSLEKLKIEQQQEAELFGLEIKTETPDLKGTHIRKTWKARIVDESKVPVNYGKMCIREINMSKLNDIAKYTEGKAKIEGVEFYQEETVVVR